MWSRADFWRGRSLRSRGGRSLRLLAGRSRLRRSLGGSLRLAGRFGLKPSLGGEELESLAALADVVGAEVRQTNSERSEHSDFSPPS